TVFDIFFENDDPVLYDEEGRLGLPGCTILGEFSESFVSPLGWWRRPAYERQWLQAAARLVVRREPSAFVLGPARLWWTAWLDGSQVVIRQQLLVAAEHAAAWRRSPASVPYELVGSRDLRETDEDSPSEWEVSLDDVREFIARRGPSV